MLREIAKNTRSKTGSSSLMAEDSMDDGAKIAIRVDIDEEKGTAVVDITGSSYEVHGNCNAPRAVTLSALISVYVVWLVMMST
ncbi:5-oxoprolinase (ATP-hydrolysing) [Mytilus galloprovincialis]|uniref:5-oxoprolinase (ATP-hydrolysing) n=1 Tax=Mytilus galloprovincialis TaxID=29158 RepID=A0A8B6F168_MYTGA|nr:5-oxoprolinase (ATP-hydrolysing) [Mytilus galloprovincialis]